jgi:hypothetical protein
VPLPRTGGHRFAADPRCWTDLESWRMTDGRTATRSRASNIADRLLVAPCLSLCGLRSGANLVWL